MQISGEGVQIKLPHPVYHVKNGLVNRGRSVSELETIWPFFHRSETKPVFSIVLMLFVFTERASNNA